MNEFLKQDIFFFLASILVVAACIVTVIAGSYLIAILKAVNHIAQKAKAESELIAEDLTELRENAEEQGANIKQLMNFFGSIRKKHKAKSSK